MKLSKSELKSIIKECLVEILNEGLGGSISQQPLIHKHQFPTCNKSLSDAVKRPTPRPSSYMREAIIREAGGNKVMESILADTASATLPKFLQAGDGKTHMPASGGIVEQVVAQTNPEDLFGDEVASKWASLAFMNTSTKK